MSKSPKLREVLRLIALLFILPACTCFGVSLERCNVLRYSPGCSVVADAFIENHGLPLINCGDVRLTSPRGGLANGVNTIYWDSVEGAVNYRISIYSGGVWLGSWEATAPATNLQADLSQNAIGGQNPFELELLAYDANGNDCRDAVVQDREAYHYVDPHPAVVGEEVPDVIVCEGDPTTPECY